VRFCVPALLHVHLCCLCVVPAFWRHLTTSRDRKGAEKNKLTTSHLICIHPHSSAAKLLGLFAIAHLGIDSSFELRHSNLAVGSLPPGSGHPLVAAIDLGPPFAGGVGGAGSRRAHVQAGLPDVFATRPAIGSGDPHMTGLTRGRFVTSGWWRSHRSVVTDLCGPR